MEYNSFIMAAFTAALLAITAFMDTPVKPTIKQLMGFFTEKTRYEFSDKSRYIVYQVAAFGLALMFVLAVDKLSFAKLFYVNLEPDYLWFDRLFSALVLSVGSKSFNWFVKFVQDNGAAINELLKLKISPPVPPAE